MAIPGLFKEHYIEQYILGDGYLCENLGVLEANMDRVLAVDVMGKNSFDNHLPDNFSSAFNAIEMQERSIRMLIYNQTKCNLVQCGKKVFVIEPKTSDFKTFDFNKVNQIKALGKGLIELYLDGFEPNEIRKKVRG